MSKLEETFGADFAKQIQQKTAEKRQERNRVTDEQMAEICAKAINESKFEEGDPTFDYTTENGVTHNVLLMQLPNPDNGDVWKHLAEPWEGAARMPFEYLGEWYWCTFPQKELLRKVQSGDWVIMVGSIEENEGDNGDIFHNIYPVRGMVTLDEAMEYAQQAMDEEGFSKGEETQEPEEKAPEPDDFAADDEGDDEEEDDDTEDPVFGGDSSEEDAKEKGSGGGLKALAGMDDDEEEEDEDDSPVPYEEVAHFVEELSEKQDEDEEPQIMELTEEHKELDRLIEITCSQLDIDNEDGVRDVVLDVIGAHQTEDEEEEEDEDDDFSGKLF